MLTIRHNRYSPLPKKDETLRIERKPREPELYIPPITVQKPSFISEKMESIHKRIMEKHNLTMEQLFASIRIKPVVVARREMMNLIHRELNWSPQRIGNYFKLDISTVQHHLGLKKRSKVKYGALNDD